ncbi:MAG: isocitrate dehydrogenase (NAD+) [Glaciecola sp.]|jgi:isocitrate dehydrogenase (NAD+)
MINDQKTNELATPEAAKQESGEKRHITIIRGDGIGPDIVNSAIQVLDKVGCNFAYDYADAGLMALENHGELLPQETLDLIAKNKVTLKGPLTTPIGEGFTSINVSLRKQFKLYANLRPVLSFKGTKARYEDIDIITVRENTQGMYSGLGQVVSADGTEAEAVSKITREGAEKIVVFAYELARREGRKKITAVHKANILKSTSGLFLKVAREVAQRYPDIQSDEMIVDNCCMQLVMNPHQFDVIVTTNLFGDILSDLCAGLVGGLGMAPGANIGEDCAIFEAVHGSAPDIAGMNLANPTSVILASIQMLEYLNMADKAERIRAALTDVIESGDRTTRDLGGEHGTNEFTQALLERL